MSVKPTNKKTHIRIKAKQYIFLKTYIFYQVITNYGTYFLHIKHSQEN